MEEFNVKDKIIAFLKDDTISISSPKKKIFFLELPQKIPSRKDKVSCITIEKFHLKSKTTTTKKL